MSVETTILEQVARQLGQALQNRQLKLATAESCTGGMVAQAITSIAGCSQWFEEGFIPYSNAAKHRMLGVKAASLEAFGAVSETVAKEMAEGALLNSQAHCSLAITGIAGPGGGSVEKPVGTVWFAWAQRGLGTQMIIETTHRQFAGDRYAVRLQAAHFALQQMLDIARIP